jgi:hypothetical protein
MQRGPALAAIIPMLAAAGALVLALAPAGPDRRAVAGALTQTPTALALDMAVNGNAAVSVGPLDSCTRVVVGDEFPVDVLVQKVTNLVAWEVYLQYDRNRLEVVGVDIGNSEDPLFLSVAANSDVINVSDPLPNRVGLYRVAAADIAIPAAPEQGSGLLARVTLKAKANGFAALGLPHLDYNKDGTFDLGPRLIALQGREIGDRNGDGFLDAAGNSGHIAVGASCDDAPQPAIEPDGSITTQPTAAPGETSGETSNGSGPGPAAGAGQTPGEDTTPEEDDDSQVTNVENDPDRPGRGGRNQQEDASSFFKLWMLGPAAGFGLLGLLFAFLTVRRSGLGL